MKRLRRTGIIVVFGVVAAAVYFVMGPQFPKDQSVNVVLGDVAPEATEVSLRYTPPSDRTAARDVVMRFERGKAPRVVHHEARLADGPYLLAVEVRGTTGTLSEERRIELRGGGSTSVDVKGVMR